MKAESAQRRSLGELVEVDAQLGRLEHRGKHLAEQAEFDRAQAEHRAAEDRLAALGIAVADLGEEASRLESDIDGVRRREDRDRALIDGGGVDAKHVGDLQHELDTLAARRSALEDALLDLMERGESLAADADHERDGVGALADALADVRSRRDQALVDVDAERADALARRSALAETLDGELGALYERLRGRGGAGAGALQGRRCGACRLEIDRGELARITGAPADEVVRCPECGAILLRTEGAAR